MISTPVATSEMLEQPRGGISSFDKRPGVRVSGDDRLHWRVKKMDYPVRPSVCLYVCHMTIHPHIPSTHTVALAILINPRIIWQVGKQCGLLSRSLVRCSAAELLSCKVIFRTVRRYFHWTELKEQVDLHTVNYITAIFLVFD